MENKHYVAVGEEAARGTKESSTVGFVPLDEPFFPKMEYDDQRRKEYRGEQSALGDTLARRMSRKWSGSMVFPMFTEGGTVVGIIGTILKHFFGHVSSALGSGAGQYYHMFSPVHNPFAAANLGAKALTLNTNVNEGATMKNWPYVGGRVKSVTFDCEPSLPLKVTVEYFGQYRDTVTAELGSPVFPDENLRCDYNNLAAYIGTITKVGSAPDYTDFTFGSATLFKSDKLSVKFEAPHEDKLRLSGLDYPDKTNVKGQFKVTVEVTIDWEDPAAGFSSVDEFNSYHGGISQQNFHFFWDTGTPAGSGDNHALHIDLPAMQRLGGDPEYGEDDPMITLAYEGLYDATALYQMGLMLKNTAAAV